MAQSRNGGMYNRAGRSSNHRKNKALIRSAFLPEQLEPRTLLSRVLYVDWQDHNGADSNDGASWQSAYTDLQHALAAAESGDEIRVADGTYKPTAGTDRMASFQLKTGVSLLGGHAGHGAPNPDARDITAYPTILSGEIGDPAVPTDNTYRIVIGSGTDGTAILDGFTITGGRADAFSMSLPRSGGGMFNDAGSPTVRNCTFIGNYARDGGGMCNVNASPTVIDCAFISNWGLPGAGGVMNAGSSPTFTGCVFNGNWTSNSGGGMYNSASSPTLTNCTFSANSAGGAGGGINTGPSSTTLTNCIVWGNSAITNPQIHLAGASTTVRYSNIQGGFAGTGNIDVDPLFVRNPSPGPDQQWNTPDDDFGDLRLRFYSPSVDAGDNSAIPAGIATDLADHPRRADILQLVNTGLGASPFVDMGAYEVVPRLEADAGGPYAMMVGGMLTLQGRGQSDKPGGLTYEWDFDGDGYFSDGWGDAPLFYDMELTARILTIALRVTDSSGASAVHSTTLSIVVPVVYVDDSARGANNGTSWANAYTSLQDALATPASGMFVRVAQGTYKPANDTNRGASFQLRDGVTIEGGYAGFGAADPAARDVVAFPSTLSGDIGAPDFKTDNSYHVVTSYSNNATAVLDGFTITAGNDDAGMPMGLGGGMYILQGSPMIRNCTITGNTVGSFGFGRNGGQGGGVYNGNASPVMINCTFTGNVANGGDGGGMCNWESSPTLINCVFAGNSTFGPNDHNGGAIHNHYSSPILTNCTFVSNNAVGYGGAIHNNGPAFPVLSNCILWDNKAGAGNEIYNSTYASATAAYSNIKGGHAGAGNISADPAFVRNPSPGADGVWGTPDDDYGDLRLRFMSPCVDAGRNDPLPFDLTTDRADGPRRIEINGIPDTGSGTAPVTDMGAYEAVSMLEAHAGGPYALLEGASIVLQGFGQSGNAGPLAYAWDLDGDGSFGDATGASPVFSAGELPGPQVRNISLRITDSTGASGTTSTTLRIALRVAYVDDSALGDGSGQTWTNACTSLQDALAMSAPGQIIRVAQGLYTPTTGTDRLISFQLRNGVTIEGGYAGHGTTNPDARDIAAYRTILSGEIGAPVTNDDNSYHVVNGSGTNATAVIDGFTVTAGHASGSWPLNQGGGMYIHAGGATIRNCTFTGNAAGSDATRGQGGGVYLSGSGAALSNCTFIDNVAVYGGGGGIYTSASTATLTNCTFSDNIGGTLSLAGDGGGMYNARSSSPTLINCVFSGNTTHRGHGGGVFNLASSPVLVNCIFTGNFVGNGYYGGGMYSMKYSKPTLINCTFAGNAAGIGGAIYLSASSPILTNCILWSNTALTSPQIYQSGGTVTITHSLIQGGHAGVGNLNADPLFIRNPHPGPDGIWATADDDYGDLRLQFTSPAIDAGRNDILPAGITTDLAGDPRFTDIPGVADTGLGAAPIVDMGAYEARIAPVPLVLPGTDAADTFTLRLSPDGLSLQVWNGDSAAGQPAAMHALSGLTTCSFAPSPGLDTLRLDSANGVPIPPAGLLLPADDQIIVTATDATRPDLLQSIRSLLITGQIASTSADPLRALCPSINGDGDILIRLALRGDLNQDDALDGDDYFEMDRAFLAQSPLQPEADLTLDGVIDAADYHVLDRTFLTLAPPITPAAPAAPTGDRLPELERELSDILA